MAKQYEKLKYGRRASIMKGDIITMVATEMDITEERVGNVLNCILKNITEKLVAGESILFTNFGTFESFYMEPKMVRNPKTGVMTMRKERRVVKFRPGKDLLPIIS